MRNIVRRLLPSPALVIAFVALFVAMGGGGYAALKGKDKQKVRAIADREISRQAPGLSVANSAKLGGVAASGYQGFCKAGAIKATVVANTTGLGGTFTNVPGFNCFRPGNTTSSVQIERIAQGQYVVRFDGNAGADASGSAVATELQGDGYVTYDVDTVDVPGENAFVVIVHNAAGNVVDNRTFSLLAF